MRTSEVTSLSHTLCTSPLLTSVTRARSCQLSSASRSCSRGDIQETRIAGPEAERDVQTVKRTRFLSLFSNTH